MRPREVVIVSGIAVGFLSLLGFVKPEPQGSGMNQLRQLGRGILLYRDDAHGVYPLGMGKDSHLDQWLSHRGIEAPAGLMRDTDPSVTLAHRSAWVNAVARYWPSPELLKIAGAPIKGGRRKLEDTIRDPWLVGVNYNGLLHQYEHASVPHPELVPLIWTGQGRANREGCAVSSPVLYCFARPGQEPCKFTPQGSFPAHAVIFPPVGPAGVFDGAMVFGMADGSAKRVLPDKVMDMKSEDPWGSYDSRGHGTTYKTDSAQYMPLFRPDRKPINDR